MATCHVRSISMPSKSLPLTLNIEEKLSNLKAYDQSSSMCDKLGGLKDLYDCLYDLLQLPHTQLGLSQQLLREYVEKALTGSFALLDACGTARDVFLQLKESVEGLEVSVRRRRLCRESSLGSEVDAHIASRTRLNKVISNCLRNLKRKEKTRTAEPSLEPDSNLVRVINILRHAEDISISVFENILAFALTTKAKSKSSSWSAVLKLLQSKRVSCDSNVCSEDEKNIDAEVVFLKSSKESNLEQVQHVLIGLQGFESSIQKMEQELECVYRRLVKTRVSLLNILNH